MAFAADFRAGDFALPAVAVLAAVFGFVAAPDFAVVDDAALPPADAPALDRVVFRVAEEEVPACEDFAAAVCLVAAFADLARAVEDGFALPAAPGLAAAAGFPAALFGLAVLLLVPVLAVDLFVLSPALLDAFVVLANSSSLEDAGGRMGCVRSRRELRRFYPPAV